MYLYDGGDRNWVVNSTVRGEVSVLYFIDTS